MPSHNAWPKALVDRLVAMKSEGRHHVEIAQELGVSRNAVCGKVHRIGLSFADGSPEAKALRLEARGRPPLTEQEKADKKRAYMREYNRRTAAIKGPKPAAKRKRTVRKAIGQVTVRASAGFSTMLAELRRKAAPDPAKAVPTGVGSASTADVAKLRRILRDPDVTYRQAAEAMGWDLKRVQHIGRQLGISRRLYQTNGRAVQDDEDDHERDDAAPRRSTVTLPRLRCLERER